MGSSDLDRQLREEGFRPLAVFHNSSFIENNGKYIADLLARIVEGYKRENQFRIVPAYFVYIDDPSYPTDRHIIYTQDEVNPKELECLFEEPHTLPIDR